MATAKPAQDIKLTKKQEALLGEWFDAQSQLAHFKAEESRLRAEAVKIFYPNGVTHDGTENWALPDNWVAKVKGSYNVKIDEAALPAVRAKLAAMEPDPETGELPTIDNAVKYKAELSISGFKALRGDVQKLLCEAVTFTPGTPQLELTKPKTAAAPKATGAHNPFENKD